MGEEVWSVLKDMNGEKAPGLDGYTVALWQYSWASVKTDVMAVFKDFFELGKFVKSLNSTFIVMIPKKEGAGDPKDFRPISLVGRFIVIAKVLANMLKKVLN